MGDLRTQKSGTYNSLSVSMNQSICSLRATGVRQSLGVGTGVGVVSGPGPRAQQLQAFTPGKPASGRQTWEGLLAMALSTCGGN